MRPVLVRAYGWIAAGTLLVSIPNLLVLITTPEIFLSRGVYVLPQGARAMAKNLLWSFLLPLHYSDDYRRVAGFTSFFSVDGVSAGLMAAGLNPLHPIAAAFFIVGLVVCWRRRRESWALFLGCVWLVGNLALGVSGPSLTRLLILLPVYLVVAALGIAELRRRFPRAEAVIAAALVLMVATHARAYFGRFAASPFVPIYFSPAATAIGQEASSLAAAGGRVLCLVAKDASVVQYLTEDQRENVRIAEFYFRPFDARELPLEGFEPEALLIEHAPAFEQLIRNLPPQWLRTHHQRFTVARQPS
jgi:hypothetical protein